MTTSIDHFDSSRANASAQAMNDDVYRFGTVRISSRSKAHTLPL